MTRRILPIICVLAVGTGVLSCGRRQAPPHSRDDGAVTRAVPAGETGGARPGHPDPGGGPGMGRIGRARAASEGPGLNEDEMKAITFQIERVSYRPVRTSLSATGKIHAHPFRMAIISYPFPARVAQVHVRPGDWVQPGRPLVTLQSEAVGQAKAEYFKALADHELARRNHEREVRLFEGGAGAGKNVQAAEAELKVAEASRNASEKKLHILGFDEERVRAAAASHEINPTITLFSPITGQVTENSVVMGSMVDQSTEILTILDPRRLCVDADIFERDIARVRKGQTVEVSVLSYPGLVFPGTIQYIGDVLKGDTRTLTIRSEVANEDLRLKPGMFASLTIILEEQSRALAVPTAAVLDDGDDQIVFVRKDGRFYPRVIVTGAKVDGYLEVLKGVTEGEEVVTNGCYQLKSRLYEDVLEAAHAH